jgi:hypothetical protein
MSDRDSSNGEYGREGAPRKKKKGKRRVKRKSKRFVNIDGGNI